MEKLSTNTLNSYIALLNTAIKDLGEQRWWIEDSKKFGSKPIQILEDLEKFLKDNYSEIIVKK